MKKSVFIVIISFILGGLLFGQNYVSVELNDNVYKIIEYAQLNGLCNWLTGSKPYTQQQIVQSLNEIIDSNIELTEKEYKIINKFKLDYTDLKYKSNNVLHAHIQNSNDAKVNVNLDYHFGWDSIFSTGIYNKKEYNQWGMDNIANFYFKGDIGDNFSYMFNPFFDLTRMPLYEKDEYTISSNGRFDGPEFIWQIVPGENGDKIQYVKNEKERSRKIKKFCNMSYLPFSYDKPWDGQMYLLSNLTATGLEGWPFDWGISGGVKSEIKASFFDDKLIIGGGRFDREIAGMDNGRSLVLNSRARPFFAIDLSASPFKFLKFTSMTGILEYPNKDFMIGNAMPNYDGYVSQVPVVDKDGNIKKDEHGNIIFEPNHFHNNDDDARYWQNALSINMIELDFKYFHFDFGGTCIWPKRLEFGYFFPLSVFVEYQNHIGDYDNLSLFANIKFRYPGLGAMWASIYVDEINGFNNNPLTSMRQMYAFQAGLKYVVPKLTFATVGFSYTKIEPYCYTHQAVKTPWYDTPIMQNYSNNGESLGYYLPPNSDEFLLTFEWIPTDYIDFNGAFQFIRHGADYGTLQAPGSSIYSELPVSGRDDMKKYFLHDGAYNWIYNISFACSYDFNHYNVPLKLFTNLGFTYSYWTTIDPDIAKENNKTTGRSEGISFKTPYEKINTSEYPTLLGGVFTIGLSLKL